MKPPIRIQAFFLVVTVRACLCCVTLPRLRGVLRRLAYGARGRRDWVEVPDAAFVAEVVRGVRGVARWVPGATCLTQALATQTLLARHGYPAGLRIGVMRDARGRLAAHAWLAWQGAVILGETESPGGYTELPGREWESL